MPDSTTRCALCGCDLGHHLYDCASLTRAAAPAAPAEIAGFVGEHRWLSNFWPSAVTLDGVAYSTVEHAYQAAKTVSPAVREVIRAAPDAKTAKRRGTQVVLRPGWDAMRVDVMRALLGQKFAPGTDLGARLEATRGRALVEANWWHDTFWGRCDCARHAGAGANTLGRLLMELRVPRG